MFDIAQADYRLAEESPLAGKELTFYDVRKAPVNFYGLYDPLGEAPFRRMPLDIAEGINRSIYNLSQQTSGGRIRFRTNSKTIALHVVQRNKTRFFPHMTAVGTSGFDLYRIVEGKQVFVNSFRPPNDREKPYDVSTQMRGEGVYEYVLNFPLYDWVTELYLGLEPGSVLEPGTAYTGAEKPVVFYGSSVTQGGCACRPGTFYAAILSRWLDVDYHCFGFSGSCKGEPEMADYLASLDPSVYVLCYDFNAPDPEHLRATHEPLFRKIRAAHPQTPIVLTSSFGVPSLQVEEPDEPERDERRAIVRATYDNAVAAGDRKVWFVDNKDVFDAFGGNDCTVDGAHPNDLGFWIMANHLRPALEQALKAAKG